MRWQIEGFVFCEKQQTLKFEQEISQLEPMVVELLAYFCRHTDEIVNREQLIEKVWRGRIITDNAVTKVINKLRKNLNDDPRKPRFIATFPKKGYRFIASVSELPEASSGALLKISSPPTNPATQQNHPPVISKARFAVAATLLTVIIVTTMIWITFGAMQEKKQRPITAVKALTRTAGNDAWPQVSPDGNYLTYMEFTEKRIHLWIKSLVDEKTIEITHDDDDDDEALGVGPAAWNSDGSKLVYLVASSTSCQYYLREINGLTLGEAKLIHNCPAGSYGRISFTHDDNKVIYTESDGTPYTLFEMNLSTGAKRRLNQPQQFVAGNNQFDLHPTQNKLLISSPDKQQWEGYYSLDLDTDELTLLFKQDAFICCGIWDHSGERVVLMGEHPAYQIVSYDQTGKDRQVVYSGSQQLRTPLRHINGKDYMFIAGYVNQNALFYDIEKQTEVFVANTSVDDRLAVFSHHNQQIAFVGLSTGSEEIWLTDTQGKHLTKLSNFNDSRHIIDLLWSYNGNYLLGLGLNQIYLIDTKTGHSEPLKIPQIEMRGVSWKNDHVFAYSTETEKGWRVNYYDINTHQVSYEDEKWAFIQYSADPDDLLWQHQNGELFFSSEQEPINNEELKQLSLVAGRHFKLKKNGTKWAWQNVVNGKRYLMLKESLQQPATKLFEVDSYHFDFSKRGLLYHTTDSLQADIYQTIADE
ncbi:MAG: winged helix-turn-helix domain-containing protein [Paraglaciecola sp.]|uniref:winged helix-turn-helix domain-containing protein n=1 Tax=Paraglaciecola sp. TaxID=1920173 RepID=UPI00329776D7